MHEHPRQQVRNPSLLRVGLSVGLGVYTLYDVNVTRTNTRVTSVCCRARVCNCNSCWTMTTGMHSTGHVSNVCTSRIHNDWWVTHAKDERLQRSITSIHRPQWISNYRTKYTFGLSALPCKLHRHCIIQEKRLTNILYRPIAYCQLQLLDLKFCVMLETETNIAGEYAHFTL